jgi:glutamate-5-semialdehyde dehydrogenase
MSEATMIEAMGKKARAAARQLALATTAQKDACLERLASCIWEARADVLAANRRDVAAGEQAGLSPAMLDRLMLNEARLNGIAADLRGVAALPDPVGETFDTSTLPNGLRVRKQRVPIGVLAIIYESRPNVTIDAAGLAIKTGNAVILRGGSETIASNKALVALVRQALAESGLPEDAVQFVDDPDRARVTELLRLNDYVDMVVPRGGAGLHKLCRDVSNIPVITGGIGICHLYVDETADLEAALPVIRNAKIQRPTVCNALDTVLVHRQVAEAFLPNLVEQLAKDGVNFRAEPGALAALPGINSPAVLPAGEADFDTEWLSLVLGLKVVDGLDEAIAHIAAHSTGHSDGILTKDAEHARRFTAVVDSAAVYVNASTRFTDGAQLGLGAEVAISTQRLHARGPMGLRELTSYKWVIEGDYSVRP